jgi:hypothetical protein
VAEVFSLIDEEKPPISRGTSGKKKQAAPTNAAIPSPRIANPAEHHLYSTAPAEAQAVVNAPRPAEVQAFFSLPVTETEYRQVYRREISASHNADLEATREAVHALAEQGSPLTSSKLAGAVHSTDDSYVLFVGHNEGGSFRFVDGSEQKLSDMAEIAVAEKKVPIFLSCGSSRYAPGAIGVHRDLRTSEALDAARAVVGFIRSRKAVSPLEIQAFLNQTQQNLKTVYLVQQGCHVAAGVLVVAIVIYLLDDRKGGARHD